MAVRADALEHLLEARALLLVLDAPRDADVIDRRHVDEEAARQRDVAGDARAFAGDGVLRHLHDDLLPFAQQIGDRRLGAMRLRDVVEVQLVRRLALVLLEVLDDVGDVEEGVALQAEVDEGGLHARAGPS